MENMMHWDEETTRLFLIWGQTEDDRAGIREFFEDEKRAALESHRARRIEMTGTLVDRPTRIRFFAEAA